MDKMEKIIHAQIHYSNASTAWHIIYLFFFLFIYLCSVFMYAINRSRVPEKNEFSCLA